jgi:hypothetical protein
MLMIWEIIHVSLQLIAARNSVATAAAVEKIFSRPGTIRSATSLKERRIVPTHFAVRMNGIVCAVGI